MNADRAVLALAIAASIPLGLETARYAYAWRSDASLWEWGVRTDPESPIALGQHAIWLYKAGRTAEARSFADRAVRAGPGLHDVVLTRARIGEADRRLADAERDYRQALKLSPDRPGSWTDLALFYQRNGRPDEAVRLLRVGRGRLPFSRAALTDNLAETLYQLGHTEEALHELETVRPIVRNELHPAASSVLFHIGLMSLELGRISEARTALVDFLDASARADDPEILRRRGRAAEILSRLARAAADRNQAALTAPTPPRKLPK
jgi:tetratricopeptide (TPR) repeat protein